VSSLALFQDTIVAVSTPNGTSALAIIRVSGSDAIRILGKVIKEPERLWVAPGNTTFYTEIIDRSESTIDDVIISVFRSPRSFTGEDLLEINCHGNPSLVSSIVSLLVESGCRAAEPGEFSRRAFFNGKISIEEAELIAVKASGISQHALRGFERKLEEKFARLRDVYDLLINLLAQVNAQIDFGESDEIVVEGLGNYVRQIKEAVRDLVQTSRNERANLGAFTVALVGPPNVGKSSLFNRILKYERSIVSDQPGTTRDYVEAFIEVEGFRIKLIDTAGIRIVNEFTEARGIELGRVASLYADLVFRVTSPEDRLPQVEQGEALLHNKIDLDRWSEGLSVSAETGEGLANLHSILLESVKKFNSEQSISAVSDAERSVLAQALVKIENLPQSDDLTVMAEEIRGAIDQIGQLLGLNVSQDTLNHIFSSMCIGK